jgi:hypothetical protein
MMLRGSPASVVMSKSPARGHRTDAAVPKAPLLTTRVRPSFLALMQFAGSPAQDPELAPQYRAEEAGVKF